MTVTPRYYKELQVPPSIFALPYHIAFILDNVVEHIMHLDSYMGEMFLSNPTFEHIDPSDSFDVFNIKVYTATDEVVMHFDERTASILLSNPIIKGVDLPSSGGPDIGWLYNEETDTFINNL